MTRCDLEVGDVVKCATSNLIMWNIYNGDMMIIDTVERYAYICITINNHRIRMLPTEIVKV